MERTTLLYETENGVATITLNKPQSLNPISDALVSELVEVLHAAEQDNAIRAVILTAAGRAFSAGGDLADLDSSEGGISGFYQHMEHVNSAVVALYQFTKPVIAAVNGAAVGAGMNLALACDLIFASEKAKFSEIFGQIGLTVDMAGAWILPRLVGPSKAKELVFTYRMIEAPEAKEMGIVNKVVPHEQLMAVANDYAGRIAAGPPMAFKLAKKMINRSSETDLKTILDMEAMAQSMCAVSEDAKEGVSAFHEKRKPVFQGK